MKKIPYIDLFTKTTITNHPATSSNIALSLIQTITPAPAIPTAIPPAQGPLTPPPSPPRNNTTRDSPNYQPANPPSTTATPSTTTLPPNSTISPPPPSNNPTISTRPPNNHPMQTRSKSQITCPRIQPWLLLTHIEPKSVKQALLNSHWHDAIKEEYNSLMKNNTWSLVPLPPNRMSIGYEWVSRFKENPDGFVNKFKACLVAKDFHQIVGYDF